MIVACGDEDDATLVVLWRRHGAKRTVGRVMVCCCVICILWRSSGHQSVLSSSKEQVTTSWLTAVRAAFEEIDGQHFVCCVL
jgi:hypothetical protein